MKRMHRKLYNSYVVEQADKEQLVKLVHHYRWYALKQMAVFWLVLVSAIAVCIAMAVLTSGGEAHSHYSADEILHAILNLPLSTALIAGFGLLTFGILYLSLFQTTFYIASDWLLEYYYGYVRKVQVYDPEGDPRDKEGKWTLRDLLEID